MIRPAVSKPAVKAPAAAQSKASGWLVAGIILGQAAALAAGYAAAWSVGKLQAGGTIALASIPEDQAAGGAAVAGLLVMGMVIGPQLFAGLAAYRLWKPAFAAVGSDQGWLEGDFIPTVQQRGAAIIKARGLSSAASAANAAVDHIRSWALGTAKGDWVSMGIPSDGSYGVPEGIISSFPVTCSGGTYEIVQGLDIDDFSRARIDASTAELAEERDAVKELGLI